MADYHVTIKPSAARDLDNLDESVAARILLKIRALGGNPRPAGVKKIKGEGDLWRIRVGDWRVIYSIDDSARVVDLVYVRHRSKAYS